MATALGRRRGVFYLSPAFRDNPPVHVSTGKLRDSCSYFSSFLTYVAIGTSQKLYLGEERCISPTYLVLHLDLAASGMLKVVSRLI